VLHCDEETLSLLALGESAPSEVADHLAECDRCRSEVTALQQVVITARSDRDHPTTADHRPARNRSFLDDLDPDLDHLDQEHLDRLLAEIPRIPPPAHVWQQIAAATGVHPDPATPPGPATPARTAPVPRVPAIPRPRPRSFLRDGRLLTLAAACLVVGLLGGVVGTRWLSDNDAGNRSGSVVAATPLAGLPAAPTASGQADVTESEQGRVLDLDVRELAPADGFYEVWLIDPTVTKMVPIGVLTGTAGKFTLPTGVNLADYPVVDVSVEPLDGNPTHSGKSVLRGTLGT
jgi:hypothetical protein